MNQNAVLLTCAILLVAGCEQMPTGPGADLVLTNGRIYTVNAERSWAEAIAITGERIAFVGSSNDAATHIGHASTVVDLGGKMVLPGFQDSHIHPISAGIEYGLCNLNDVDDLAVYRTIIGEYAAANPDLEWITGGGWSLAVFGPGGSPSKNILDELVPDRPVYLTSADGHTGWANSAALAIAGITADTPNPPDGIIDRDPETGEIVGSLQEGAMSLVSQHVPAITLADRMNGMRFARDLLHSYGITSINEAIAQRPELETYQALEQQGELNLRVVASIWWDREQGVEQIEDIQQLSAEFSGGSLLRTDAVKIMQDGVMENYTAALLEPYLIESGSRGIPMVEPELLKQAVSALDARGFQVHFHAIGTAAIRQSLDAVEEALIDNGQMGLRHHISHLQLIHPDDLPRFADLEVVANFQPLWAYEDDYVTDLTRPYIGEDRAAWLYPIKSVQNAGGLIAFGSDWSVSTANPFPQIETALTRKDAMGTDTPVLNASERIDLETAIAAFTINAAYLNRHDRHTGSIEVGKYADLVVLNQNLFDIEPSDISDTEVLLTLFAGRPVHGDLQGL